MDFAQEILQTPAVLADLAAGRGLGQTLALAAERLRAAAPAPILLTGMGSSHFAAHYGACLMEAAGLSALALDTGDLVTCHPASIARLPVKVVISQSGRSAEVLDLVAGRSGGDTWIAVTNEPDSPLARAADTVLALGAGAEEMTASKTFFATLALLALLADEAAGGSWHVSQEMAGEAEDMAQALVGPLDAPAAAVAEAVVAGGPLVLLGKSTALCAARQGALILQEAARADAAAMTYGEWRHGPVERARPGLTVVAVAPGPADPEAERVLAETSERGAAVLRLAAAEGAVPWRRPFAPTAALYRALLEVGRRRGSEVGRLAHKVTGR
ncbi:MAG: SIS domain-containing protein [Firmicutes bacterium]|nr:SIS domain-containing protein [Bacillota bacterium]